MVGVLQKTHCCKDCNLVDGHPVIDHGTVDGYKKFIRTALIPQPVLWPWNMWYMMAIFTEHDVQKEGFVKLATFPSMLHEFLATPLEHGLTSLSKDTYETLFKKYDPKNDGRLAVDEQMHLAKEEVLKKFL